MQWFRDFTEDMKFFTITKYIIHIDNQPLITIFTTESKKKKVKNLLAKINDGQQLVKDQLRHPYPTYIH